MAIAQPTYLNGTALERPGPALALVASLHAGVVAALVSLDVLPLPPPLAGRGNDRGAERPGGGMSREQGPRIAGMRPAAIAAGRRQHLRSNHDDGSEAVA